MKKIIKRFLLLVFAIISIFDINMIVKAYTNQETFSSYVINGFYIKKIRSNGTGQYRSMGKISRDSDGRFVYCVQPWVVLDESNTYSAFSSGQAEKLGVSLATWKRLSLIAYYGYGYPGHDDERWYGMTQLMIWQTVDPDGSFFFTRTPNGETDHSYDWMKEEIESLINSHYTVPNFNTNSITVNIGETIVLNDSNNVLNDFNVSTNNSNISVSKNGNQLSITANSVGNTNITLSKILNKGAADNVTVLYDYSDAQKTISSGFTDPVYDDLNINVVGAKIRLIKNDSKTRNTTPSGQATLVGAEYGIYLNNNLIQKLTIGADSTATSDYLPLGTYTIKEINPSKGYELDNNVYTVNVNSSTTINLNVYEDVIENYISILKQYDYVDGDTTFLNAEKGITFEIYSSDGNKYTEITTDKNGYATINIPYGVWKFHQVNSNTGFEKIYDFYVTVDENSEKEQYYNILNNKISAYLQIIKVDSETNKEIALADTTFRILNTDTNQYVSQYVAGKVYDKFITDETGKTQTYLKLEAGNYKIVEITSPKGYLINTDGVDFTIGTDSHYAYTTYGAIVTVRFNDNPIKGQIQVNKVGEKAEIVDDKIIYQEVPLENVKFEIYAKEDILSSDKNTIYYYKNTLVDTIITDANGYGISKKLPLGVYYIVEVSTNEDYVLDSSEYEFTLKEIDNKTPIVYESYSKINYLKKGTLEFTKTDLVSGEVIPNTKIEVYTENDELIFKGITDDKGKVIIKNIPIGKFYIIETEPATGYLITTEKVLFEIKEDGEIVKANMSNKKITSTVKIHKVDPNNNPIENVELGVYDKDGNLIYSAFTDSNGDIELEVEYGKSYYWQEIASIDGYKLSDEKVYFDVTIDGEIIQRTLVNVPDTDSLEKTFLILDCIGMLIVTVSMTIYLIYAIKDKKLEYKKLKESEEDEYSDEEDF